MYYRNNNYKYNDNIILIVSQNLLKFTIQNAHKCDTIVHLRHSLSNVPIIHICLNLGLLTLDTDTLVKTVFFGCYKAIQINTFYTV